MTLVATTRDRSRTAEAARRTRPTVVAFALLCLVLALVACASWEAHAALSLRTPDIWGLTALAWMLLDLVLALLLTALVCGARPVLAVVAFALIAVTALVLLATSPAGRLTGAFSLLALFVAGLVALGVMGSRPARGRRAVRDSMHRGVFLGCIAALVAVPAMATSIVAHDFYEAASRTYGTSPDGRWTLVYIRRGAGAYFPSAAVVREFSAVVQETRVCR